MTNLDPPVPSHRQRQIGIAAGVAGLLANPWILGALLAPDGSIDGEARVRLILLVDVVLVLSGVALAWRWPRRALRPFVPNAFAAAALVAALSLSLVGVVWGITAYRGAHRHTMSPEGERAPTPAERQWAETFVERSLQSARDHGWFDFEKAQADGFELQWGDREHYFNRSFLFDDRILDPDRPEFLMYRDTPRGKLLMGFMFYGRTVEEVGPRPGGSLASWHFHPWGPRGYCAEKGVLVVSRPDDSRRCAEGEFVTRSAEMLHVWFVDHPLGPYADAMLFPDDSGGWDVTLLHPAAVHFAVALLVVAVLLDLLGKIFGRAAFHSAAFVNLTFAAFFAVVTVAAGMAAEVRLLISHDVHQVLDTHKLLGFSTCAAVVVLLGWRLALRGAFPIRSSILYLVFAIGTAGLATAASAFGAELVYVHGVAVKAIDRFALQRLERTVFGDPDGTEGTAAPPPGASAHGHE
jgi:uncharacterized membrane protein